MQSLTGDSPTPMQVGTEPETHPLAPLLLTAEQAAGLVGVSRSHWWSLHSAGLVPLPVKLGRATRWRRDEIVEWVAAGCPPRHEWNKREGG